MAELLIKHVFGNVMRVAIPLTQRIRTMEDGHETETESDFYPNTSKPIQVVLKREGNLKKSYIPTVEDNVVTFEDDGTLPTGLYDVTVLCYDANKQPCRYMVRGKIKVVSATKDAGIEAGIEFDSVDYTLEGAIYFYAKGDKGDKGDPFTYEDFTEEQILDIKRPSLEAAEVANEATRLANQATQDANAAARLANEEAGLAEQKAEEARVAAINAKADYVGADNYVYHWNVANQQYEKTNIYVKGDQGVSVQSIEQIQTSTESGGINIIRVTLTNGNTSDFQIRNGQKVEPRVVGTTLVF